MTVKLTVLQGVLQEHTGIAMQQHVYNVSQDTSKFVVKNGVGRAEGREEEGGKGGEGRGWMIL